MSATANVVASKLIGTVETSDAAVAVLPSAG
jgi:hypothetical protein